MEEIEYVFLLAIALVIPVIYIVGGVLVKRLKPITYLPEGQQYITEEDERREEIRQSSQFRIGNYLVILGVFLLVEVPLIFQALSSLMDLYLLTMLLVAESIALIMLPVLMIRITAGKKNK